jgi:pimeloyl-ACP methyl ester carboxylesterase
MEMGDTYRLVTIGLLRIPETNRGVCWSGRRTMTTLWPTLAVADVDASLEGASHWMQLDQPARVNDLILRFLKSS